MALTAEQRAKLKAAGYSDTKINVFEAQKTIKQKDSEPGYIDRLKSSFQGRQEEIKDINSSGVSLGEKVLQNVGQVAGGVSDIVSEAPGIKQGLDIVGKGIAKVPGVKQVAGKVAETYNKLPERAKDNLEAVGNIASIIPVGIGAKGSIVAGEKALAGTAKVAKGTVSATKKVAGEIIPTADRVVNNQVSKALDLTAGDIKNINLATGNEVGEFLAKKNLIRGNKDETAKALKDFFDTNYKTVRDEISNVKKTYNAGEVPRFKQSLEEIQKQVGETTGLEDVSKEINTLLKKETIALDDVQRVKELVDDHFSLYKVTGDVKEGVAKQGMSNLRKDLKEFIEKEVKENTGADIKALNNEVSTAKSTLNAIEARSTRGLTKSNITLGDYPTFGVGFMLGGIPGGAAAVAAKKIIETSAFKLKFAKLLDGWSDAKKLKVRQELLEGKVPLEVKQIYSKPNTNEATANTTKNIKKSISKTVPKVKEKVNIKNPKAITPATKKEMAEVIDYVRLKKPYNQELEEMMGKLTEKYGITSKSPATVANKLEDLIKKTK